MILLSQDQILTVFHTWKFEVESTKIVLRLIKIIIFPMFLLVGKLNNDLWAANLGRQYVSTLLSILPCCRKNCKKIFDPLPDAVGTNQLAHFITVIN